MKIASKIVFVFACVTGAMSVLTAAYVAHQHALSEEAVRSLQSSVQLQQIHALGLLVVAWIAMQSRLTPGLAVAALSWVLGIVLFSFNIQLRQLAGLDIFKQGVPYGGMAYVLGWLALGYAGFTYPSVEK
jgi:uncharacterized membrane protein YgdD (TMEM256/DUF423 family)